MLSIMPPWSFHADFQGSDAAQICRMCSVSSYLGVPKAVLWAIKRCCHNE